MVSKQDDLPCPGSLREKGLHADSRAGAALCYQTPGERPGDSFQDPQTQPTEKQQRARTCPPTPQVNSSEHPNLDFRKSSNCPFTIQKNNKPGFYFKYTTQFLKGEGSFPQQN